MAERLSEDALAALERTHKKIAIVDWQEHQLVFRRPTRDECHAYRVKQEQPETKADALEQHLQQTIVSFDGEGTPLAARTGFLAFLDENPMFASSARGKAVFASLSGLVELEDAADLGKGLSVRPAPRKPMHADSPSGSATAPGGPN
jgi:hypothetical protein